MTLTTIAIAVALIVFVLARRMRGEAVPRTEEAVPPAHRRGRHRPAEPHPRQAERRRHRGDRRRMRAVAGPRSAAGSPGQGLPGGRGALHGLERRLGGCSSPSTCSAKLALDAGGVAAGGTTAALSSSILLSLGLTLLGEAVVVWQRAQSLPTGARRRGPVPWGRAATRSAHHLAPDPVSANAGAGYLFLYEGRFARVARLVALAVIVGTAFIGKPHASLAGHGLVILISLIVAAVTQVADHRAPHRAVGAGADRARRGELRRPGRLRADGGHRHPADLRRAQCRRQLRPRHGREWSPPWPW